jgi:mRNA interferase RelE/StbE
MKRIVYDSTAYKALSRIQPAKRDDIRNAVGRYAEDPYAKNNNVKPLLGRKGAYRIRVGDWRVICELTSDAVIVHDVLPRGETYTKKNWR